VPELDSWEAAAFTVADFVKPANLLKVHSFIVGELQAELMAGSPLKSVVGSKLQAEVSTTNWIGHFAW
jgi:hypothetical protein